MLAGTDMLLTVCICVPILRVSPFDIALTHGTIMKSDSLVLTKHCVIKQS